MVNRSPWDPPAPRFVEVPAINPKTGKPPVLYICSVCGAVVGSRRLHVDFHGRQTF